ncbi:MAG: RNA-binding protein [Candidatus Marsarchaeota archaeon]|jgi:exosome complex component RRP42|nr:RNA-binding protein [Candidatus Marsarchaeota archaeon]
MSALDIVRKGYIKELLAKGQREDSRGMLDFRKISIKTGIIDHAEGSAQVDLGNTRVLAGVKVVIEEPKPDTPNQGNLVMSAELLPLANADYETGPPSPDAIELARVVDRGIRAGNCLDLESMFIEEGKAWSAYIDLYILNYDGNLFDACEIAAMAALSITKMPSYSDGAADYSKRDKPAKINTIVTSTTFGKIDGKLVLDMTGTEEDAADARLTIETDGSVIRAMQKGLSGAFSADEIKGLINESFKKHAELRKLIEESVR